MRRAGRPGWLLAAAAAVAAGPALAEPQILPKDAEGAAAMAEYVRTEAYRKLMAQAMARVPAAVLPRCPKLGGDEGAVIVQQAPRFGPDKAPQGGAWRHSRLMHGCGPEVVVSFFFFAGPERVITVVGVPGTSRTDLNQQRDARTHVLTALSTVVPACRQFETVDTRWEGWGNREPELADPGEGAGTMRPWWETWTMAGCGKRWAVPLNFIPNRLGLQMVQPGGIVPR